jgi:tetratricopeptide (TPR) repeat protein
MTTTRTVRILCLAVLLSSTFAGAQDAPSAAMRYFKEGSAHYIREDFKKAIGPYSKALELEKQQPTLDKNLWRVLIDNLGMAYGVSGDLAKAKETFEYGLSKDPNYPMFYYNLACTYGEMHDIDHAIANLKLAFQHKANAIPGEGMPDPATDSSFERFLGNERFRQALSEIASANKAAPQADRLTITERPDDYELTVPVSRLVMNIPKQGLQQQDGPRSDATASPRYFYLKDPTTYVILSGWFEAQEEFPGMVKFWEGETAAWARDKLPKPINVTFKKIGGWDAILYQLPPAGGSGSHIRAHWLQAGTWIDIHLSNHGEGSADEQTERLAALLGRIRVSEK